MRSGSSVVAKVSWSRTAGGNSLADVGGVSLRVECESGMTDCEWTVSGFAPSREAAMSRAERAALATQRQETPDAILDALMVAAQEGRAYLVVNGHRDTSTLFGILKKVTGQKK